MVSDDLLQLVHSRKTEDRIRGMQRLARRAGPDTQPLLLEGLKDKNTYVAAIAAEALGECADLSAAGVMIEHFERLSEDGPKLDPGCHIRAHLAFAFGRLEYLHADEVLRIGIRTVQMESVGGVPFDTGAHLRANCALSLAQIRAPGALRDISLLLFDDGSSIFSNTNRDAVGVEPRKAAARALGMLGTVEARVPLTIRLLFPHGESADVIQQCMQSLVDLEDPDAPALLNRLLNRYVEKDNPELAVFAGLMLARAHADGAEQTLRRLVDQYSGDAMRAAILALVSLRTELADIVLKELSADDRRVVRDAIAELVPG
jgi:HEAT repeat protein